MSEVINKQAKLINTFLNDGFSAKSQNNLKEAVNCFSQALKLNPQLQLETMLVFDISGMLKEVGEYEKAAGYLKKFLSTRASSLSAECLREAETNLKYIDCLQDLLDKAKTPNLPLYLVPTIIKISAENNLSEWKKIRYGI